MPLPVKAVAIIGTQNNPLLIKKFQKNASLNPASSLAVLDQTAHATSPSSSSSSSSAHQSSISSLKINFICHTMIDIIEERIAASLSAAGDKTKQQDCYLGLLAVLEDLAVFGYLSCTGIKYLVFVQVEDKTIKDVDVKHVFKQLVDLYVKCSLNVFYDPFALKRIESKGFLEAIDKLAF